MEDDDYASDLAMTALARIQSMYDEFEQQANCPIAYRLFIESSHAYIQQTIHDHDTHEHHLILDVHHDLLHEAFHKHFVEHNHTIS